MPAYRPMFTPAVQMFTGAFNQAQDRQSRQEALARQLKGQQDAEAQQRAAEAQLKTRNQLMGEMLGGGELGKMDPLAYMKAKEFMDKQDTIEGSPEENRYKQTLITQSLAGNKDAFNKLAGKYSEDAKYVQDILKSRSGMSVSQQRVDAQDANYLQKKNQEFGEFRDNMMGSLSSASVDERPALYSYFKEQAGSSFPELGKSLPGDYNDEIDQMVNAFGSGESAKSPARYQTITFGENKDLYSFDRATENFKLVKKGEPRTPKLTSFGESEMNKLQASALEAGALASRYDNLAARFEELQPAAGWFGSVWGSFKDAAGMQDVESEIRTEFNSSRMKTVLKSLPVGSASDVDVNNAMKGVPPENANAESISSFLRGMAKIEKMAAIIADVKSQWYEQNTSTGLAKRDFEVNGQLFKKGSRLNDAIEQVVAMQMPPDWTKEQQTIIDEMKSLGIKDDEIVTFMRSQNAQSK